MAKHNSLHSIQNHLGQVGDFRAADDHQHLVAADDEPALTPELVGDGEAVLAVDPGDQDGRGAVGGHGTCSHGAPA